MDSDYSRGRTASSLSGSSPKQFWRNGLGGHLEGVSLKAKTLGERANRFSTAWKRDPLHTGVKPHIKAYEAAMEHVYGDSPCRRRA
jgi:hypothetical protein